MLLLCLMVTRRRQAGSGRSLGLPPVWSGSGGQLEGQKVCYPERGGFARHEEAQARGACQRETETGPCSHRPKGTGWIRPCSQDRGVRSPQPDLRSLLLVARIFDSVLGGQGRQGRPQAHAALPCHMAARSPPCARLHSPLSPAWLWSPVFAQE